MTVIATVIVAVLIQELPMNHCLLYAKLTTLRLSVTGIRPNFYVF